MVRRIVTAVGMAAVLASGYACSSTPDSPTSPAAAPTGSDAAADGSTLKVTAPTLQSPINTVQLQTLSPTFVLANSSARFSTTPALTYRIEISTPAGVAAYTVSSVAAGSGGTTTWQIPEDLALDADFRWRARAEYNSTVGPWSAYGTFRSLDYRGLNPRPENGVWPRTPDELVAYITDSWANYLRPTDRTAERIANMEFLRDRMIEAGVCGGIDVALNLKRGVGPHSTDAIAWRTSSGDVEVVDIARAFDDKTTTLELQWSVVEGPSGYDPYPNHPGC
ncbi:MAG: hypothetical protein HQ485_11585 [Acidobacteria bacterium]|nr:hypothetical protein [Acidobacteriota bacterium]